MENSVLFEGLKRDCPVCWAYLLDKYTDFRKIYPNHDEYSLEDCWSEAIKKICEDVRKQEKEIKCIVSYTIGIGRNKVVDYYKEQKKEGELIERMAKRKLDGESTYSKSIYEVIMFIRKYSRELNTNNVNYEKFLVLRFQAYKPKEIAEILGIDNVNTVSRTIKRGLKKLIPLLKEKEFDYCLNVNNK